MSWVLWLVGVGVIAGLVLRLPRERVLVPPPFDETRIGNDPAAWFAAAEARFDDITPGAEKRIHWVGDEGTVTPLAVLYVHGFSATSEEIRPVPDRVARGLDANLVYTRLTGHGRSGAAMVKATGGDWIADMEEALAVAARVGERVLIIATSTGGTLAAIAAVDSPYRDRIAGIAFLSPNFGLSVPTWPVLAWPGARIWGPLLAGRERRFEPVNETHARFWTLTYPSVALLPMVALVRYALGRDVKAASAPALFLYSEKDRVVSPAATRKVARSWGGAVTLAPQEVLPGSDRNCHVIAGDALSPPMTAPTVAVILDWARPIARDVWALPLRPSGAPAEYVDQVEKPAP